MTSTVFEYRYRDAGNFKATGTVALKGRADKPLVDAALASLQDGEFFIAEQLGVPPLYEQLYRWSGGPTAQDHCWHEFVAVRQVEDADAASKMPRLGSAQAFFEGMAGIRRWHGELSPHWDLAKC